MKHTLIVFIFLFLVTTLQSQIIVYDMFGRQVNERGVSLVDWQGHLMNPMAHLKLVVTQMDGNFPLEVKINASGTSRLMLDTPSMLSATGAQKTVRFNSASDTVKIKLAIAPDRAGGYGEIETYALTFTYAERCETIPIKVLDLDEGFEPKLPLVFDYRSDSINYLYSKDEYRIPSELAAKDWFYFFDYDSFDVVPVGGETVSIPGNNWENHIESSNNKPYNGFWIFKRSIDEPWSTGYPSTTGKRFTINGVEIPGQIPRSAVMILQDNPRANWHLSVEDEDWYRTCPRTVDDVYGVMVHEFGHSIVFHNWIPGFKAYSDDPGKATKVIRYQRDTIPVASAAHLVGDERSWDRLSGHSAGYGGVFPPRRWMLTKLTLLIAEEVGWKLREIGPFIAPEIVTDKLPSGKRKGEYKQLLKTNMGGVPVYDWTITRGKLPEGLELDRFTGEISGAIKDKAGSYSFTVQLKDGDEFTKPVIKSFDLEVVSK